MKILIKTLLMFVFITSIPVLAQEEGSMPMAPPPPLDDSWIKWMVGEWKGSTLSAMGKTNDHMDSKMEFDGQFLVSTYTATGENGESMVGMSLITKTLDGKMNGYWVDSWRSMSQGTGTQEGNISRTEWTTPMGLYVRITEKVDENTMRITGIMPGPDGKEMRSETELKRVLK